MGTYEEHISGATKNENRMVLMECINYYIEHQVNYLLLSELSRLGRSILQVLKSLEQLHESRVSVYIQKLDILSRVPIILYICVIIQNTTITIFRVDFFCFFLADLQYF